MDLTEVDQDQIKALRWRLSQLEKENEELKDSLKTANKQIKDMVETMKQGFLL